MSDQDYVDPELAAEEAALQQQLAGIAAARGEVQAQTRGLEGDIGSFRAEQKLAVEAAHTATVELATAQGGDFYSPDVGQQVAPDGTVSYDFDAHLHARGVDLDAGPLSTPPSEQVIRWLRLSDGAQVASVTAYSDPVGLNEASIRARDAANARIATLRCNVANVGGANEAVYAQAVDQTTTADFTHKLIDNQGRSSFLKLIGAMTSPTPLGFNIAVNVGTASFAFNGGFTTGPAIAHGLGGVPTCVLLTPISNVGPPVLNVITVTATTFTPQVVTPGFTGAGTVTFFWLAIGPGA